MLAAAGVEIARVRQGAVADEGTRGVQDCIAAHVWDGRENPGAVKEPGGFLDPTRQVMAVKSRDVFDRGRKEGVPARVGEWRRGRQDGGLRCRREIVKPAREVVQDCALEVTRGPASADGVGVMLEGEAKVGHGAGAGGDGSGWGRRLPAWRRGLRECRGLVFLARDSGVAHAQEACAEGFGSRTEPAPIMWNVFR